MSSDFPGAGVALITPFQQNFEIDYPALARVIESQIAGGMDYLVALGTTGETPTLAESEKKELVSFIRETAAGRVPVVVGMGGNDTRSILTKMEEFDYDGICGLLVVTPYYNKPSQEGLFRHYAEVARHSPVPVILYNVPSRTGVNMEADTVIRLANFSDKIVAVKEASGIFPQISRIIKNAPPHFSVISGDDSLALPTIAVGGRGVISVVANVLPAELSSMIRLALAGNYEEARRRHLKLEEILRLLFLDGSPGGVKALLEIMGVSSNVLRLPLVPVNETVKNLLTKAFQSLQNE